ncbi:MAG: ABC transporter ATP-binding protein [Bdellovibrionales bacterium]|nr:ABC transporter ATP-binding protein [Bdellovibrionales bacterium]
MILQTKNLSMTYKQGENSLNVLNDIELNFEQGQTVSITGTSGSGKTTLLSLLAGLESPTSGDIIFEDKSLAKMSLDQITNYRAKDIGIIFQQFHLLHHLTALENAALPLEINGDPKAYDKAKEFLTHVKLDRRMNHFPNQLSGGECQRVAIARAFVHSPKIIFADEPTGNLDQGTSNQIMKLLFNLISQYKMTFILVTHDLDLAARCGHTVHLSAGKVQ